MPEESFIQTPLAASSSSVLKESQLVNPPALKGPSLADSSQQSPEPNVKASLRDADCLHTSYESQDLNEMPCEASHEDAATTKNILAPPAYGENNQTFAAFPVARLSESSRSDRSSGEQVYAQTTVQTISTTTTLFRLPRRKRLKDPLFPLPQRPSKLSSEASHDGTAPSSKIVTANQSPARFPPTSESQARRGNPCPSVHVGDALHLEPRITNRPTPSSSIRNRTSADLLSQRSSALSLQPPYSGAIPGRNSHDRTSIGQSRKSYTASFFSLSRLGHASDVNLTSNGSISSAPGTPSSHECKTRSSSVNQQPHVIPERQEGDTPAKYLARLEESIDRSIVAAILSRSSDDFSKLVLRSYMRGFRFFGDPIDISVRKLLMEVVLPKETQQIDRVLQAFANRYHECNPGVYASPETAYFIAFSILILHTDAFNKNNKVKMQKLEYIKIAQGQEVAEEILDCFYDNIVYTPFIHVEDVYGGKLDNRKIGRPRRSIFKTKSTDTQIRALKEPVDPYAVILDNQLELLRAPIKGVMDLDDHYSYTADGDDMSAEYPLALAAFSRYAILQIVSSRSRPYAFSSPEASATSGENHPGLVNINIAKVGILWRKDPKKKTARSPWQEWGAILTAAQLYLFRNHAWVRGLMHQMDAQRRHKVAHSVIFKPALRDFKPDIVISTADAVLLRDLSYKKHKNAFLLVRHGGLEEMILADNESDYHDWLTRFNVAAAFHSARVTMQCPMPDLITEDGSKNGNHSETILGKSQQGCRTAAGQSSARQMAISTRITDLSARLNALQLTLEGHLRNARHLQILAPIQDRTRGRIVLAAGRMAAKIRWIRIDMWRAQCHRDTLALDTAEQEGKGPLNLIDTSQPSSNQGVIGSCNTHDGQADELSNTEISALSQAALQKNPTFDVAPQCGVSLAQYSPPLGSGSFLSSYDHQMFMPAESKASLKSDRKSLGNRSVSDTEATALLRGEKLHAPRSLSAKHNANAKNLSRVCSPQLDRIRASSPARPGTAGSSGGISESDSGIHAEFPLKIRRSLHRTLRDQQARDVPSRNTKYGEAGGIGAATSERRGITEHEGLIRTSGSFTLHGKKASVINLEPQWSSKALTSKSEFPP